MVELIIGGISVIGAAGAAFHFKTKYEKLSESLNLEINKKLENAKEQDEAIQRQLTLAQEQEEEFNVKLSKAQENEQKAKEQLNIMQTKLETIQSEFTIYQRTESGKKEELSSLQNQLSSLQEQLQQAQNETSIAQEQLQQVQNQEKDFHIQLENAQEEAQKALTELNNAKNQLTNIEDIQNRVNNLEAEINQSKEELLKEKEITSILSDEKQKLESQISDLENNIKTLSETPTPVVVEEIKENKEIKVLLVDDSLVVRTKMQKVLVEAGYKVTTANDGADALENVLPNNNNDFDLIITDLEMPNIDGFALIEKLNENETTKNIPVFAMTGHEKISIEIQKCLNLYGVYRKPCKDHELIHKINFIIK